MRAYRFVFFLATIIFLWPFTSIAADKCNCPPKRSLDVELDLSNLAFVGQVVEIRQKFPLHPGFAYVRFLPMKKYKGFDVYPKEESVIVFMPAASEACTINFIKGNDYLVFAKGNPAFLKTNACDLTGLQEDRAPMIITLDKSKQK